MGASGYAGVSPCTTVTANWRGSARAEDGPSNARPSRLAAAQNRGPGRIIAGRMGQTEHVHGREGRPGARPHDEIGYHAIRVGDNPGEHTIVFALLGEMVEVTVRATNRDCYALGALAAAKYLVGREPGLYAMNDLLGF